LLALAKQLLTGRKKRQGSFDWNLLPWARRIAAWWTRFSSRRLLKTSLDMLTKQTLSLQRYSLSTRKRTKASSDELNIRLYSVLYIVIACP
jgi:hypothetical protein